MKLFGFPTKTVSEHLICICFGGKKHEARLLDSREEKKELEKFISCDAFFEARRADPET